MCKACANAVDGTWSQLVKLPRVFHVCSDHKVSMRISTGCTHFITQLAHTYIHIVSELFTSVNRALSPLSTQPTITTTIHINTYIRKAYNS